MATETKRKIREMGRVNKGSMAPAKAIRPDRNCDSARPSAVSPGTKAAAGGFPPPKTKPEAENVRVSVPIARFATLNLA